LFVFLFFFVVATGFFLVNKNIQWGQLGG